MDLKKVCKADKALMESGVSVEIGEGSSIFVASLGNARQVEFEQAEKRKLRKLGDAENVRDIEKIENESLSRFVLLDWKNIEEDGKKVAPTPENRKRLLEEYPEFKSLVIRVARDWTTFERREQEQAAKN